jgi:predicted ATPase
MLIAVSGTQGVGKTTLLNELKKIDYSVDNFKVSRTVQQELGFATLNEAVSSDWNTMAKFQDTIMSRKFANDCALSTLKTNDIIFVERSFIDILAYTEKWNFQLATQLWHNKWMNVYREQCLDMQKIYDGLIFVEHHEKIPFEDDVNRADKYSQHQIQTRLKELAEIVDLPTLVIKEYNLNTRVQEVINFTETLK